MKIEFKSFKSNYNSILILNFNQENLVLPMHTGLRPSSLSTSAS